MDAQLLQGLALGAALVSKAFLDQTRGVDELAFDGQAREVWKLLNDPVRLKEWFAARGISPKENRPLCEGVIDELGRRGRERTQAEGKRLEEFREVLEQMGHKSKLVLTREEAVAMLTEQIDELMGRVVAGKVCESKTKAC